MRLASLAKCGPTGYNGPVSRSRKPYGDPDRVLLPIVSARMLTILAAFVWYAGGIVLLLKGGSLLAEATALSPGQP
jgi:hypothetical protein